MTLQKKTLLRYRQIFPHDTLRETSARTGIQITRVFRLYNGKTMKVGELEAFEKTMTSRIAEKPSLVELNSILDEATGILTNDEFSKINDYIRRRVRARTYGRILVTAHYEQAIIA